MNFYVADLHIGHANVIRRYIVELSVDLKKKMLLQKSIAQEKKSVRIILTISKLLLFVGLVGGIIYVILNLFIPSMSIVNVNGVAQKDISWIVISTSLIVVPCVIIAICLKTLANNLAGVNNSARVDESLLISNETIRYSFRIKHQSLSSERRVITIQLSQVGKINYDSHTEALEFVGSFESEYFDDFKKKDPVDTTLIEKFTIYDYFLPSLKDSLLSKGIAIK